MGSDSHREPVTKVTTRNKCFDDPFHEYLDIKEKGGEKKENHLQGQIIMMKQTCYSSTKAYCLCEPPDAW